MNNVVAVIITYNIGERFKKSIAALKNQVKDIIVVDNGSKVETIAMLNSLDKDINLIMLNENKGIAYALNRGIEKALDIGCDWIITLDHDSIVHESMIDNMLKSYEKYQYKEKVAMITPVHVEEKLTDNFKTGNGIEEVLTEITSGAMVKSEIYKHVGMYDENLFIDLVDHDYCLDLNKRGYKILQDESAILVHNLGDSVNKKLFGVNLTYTNHSPVRRYYMTRNRMHIWNKYKDEFPDWIKTDKKKFCRELAKILIYEDRKIQKCKMILKGREDYKKNKFNKFN